MYYRTVVNMNNKNALITKAMLASYINEKQIDYLGMLEPFIVKSLPEEINSVINIELIAKKINDDFGLDIKQKIVEKILLRLCKEKRGKLVRKESHKTGYLRDTSSKKYYYVNKIVDNEDFDKRKEKMEVLVSEIVTKLQAFFIENYNQISYEEAQNYFINFLNNYNYELYSDVENLRKIQSSEKYNSCNFRVARFIISENKKNGCYDKIKEIQAGYFASVAIYYFCKVDNEKTPSKIIDKTSIILDTRILIDVLGLNRISETEAMKELLLLIKENGGKLCTFDYYIYELEGIINKYLTDLNARATIDLDYFRREKISNTEIKLYLQNLEDEIIQQGITIIRETDYTKIINQRTWHIDPLELKSNMSKLIDYQYGESDIAYENDFNSLQAIAYYKYSHEKNKTPEYIFITSNIGIVQTAKYTFKDKMFRKGLDIVMSDIELTATLWLSNYNSKSKIPDLILIENAYAAIYPTKDILKKVLTVIDRNIASNNERIKNDALLLRYNENIFEDIAEVTENDSEKISDSIFQDLTKKQENRVRTKVLSEEKDKIENNISSRYEKIYKSRMNNLENRENEINEKRNQIIQDVETVLEAVEATTELYNQNKNALDEAISENDLIRQENENIKYENEKMKIEKKNMIKKEYDKIEHNSKLLSNICKHILSVLISIFMFGILYIVLKTGLSYILADIKISNILYQIITIAGTILTFYPVESYCLKRIKSFSNTLKDFIYIKYCNYSSVLNSLETNEDSQ